MNGSMTEYSTNDRGVTRSDRAPRAADKILRLLMAGCLAFGGVSACEEGSGSDTAAGYTPVKANVTRGKVVVISVDGLRPDAVAAAPAPNIKKLADRGAASWQAQTVRPSITLPSHTSMLTGFSPSEHDVTWNSHRAGHVKVPTFLALAEKAALRTMLVSGKEKFFQLAPQGSVDLFVWASGGDEDVARSAIGELAKGFDAAVVHLPGTDDMGHAKGWMSAAYLAQVRAADAAVGKIVDALPADVTVILTSDHGGQDFDHGEDIPENTTIPWIIAGPGVRKGHALKFDVWTTDTAATAARVLGLKLPPAAIGRPVEEAFEASKDVAGEACSAAPNDGMPVAEIVVPEVGPVPAGGTLVPGTYQLASVTVYSASALPIPRPTPTSRTFKGTLRVSAGANGELTLESVDSTGDRGVERRSRAAVAPLGTTLEQRPLCSQTIEPGSVSKIDYTATASEIALIRYVTIQNSRYPQIFRYARRP